MRKSSLFLVILLVCLVFASFALVTAEPKTWDDWINTTDIAFLQRNVTCGDALCDVGENIYNCPVDCSLQPVTLSVDFFDPRIPLGAVRNYSLTITNEFEDTQQVVLFADGELVEYVTFPNTSIVLEPLQQTRVQYTISIPSELEKSTLQGHIILVAGGNQMKVPLTLLVTGDRDEIISLDLRILSQQVRTDGTLNLFVKLFAYELKPVLVNLDYSIREEGISGKEVYSFNETKTIRGSQSSTLDIPINDTLLKEGTYILTISTNVKNMYFSDSEVFAVDNPFWTPFRVRVAAFIVGLLGAGFLVYLIARKYIAWKRSRMRYLFPDFDLVPKKTANSLWLGKIPESTKKAYWDPNTLTTHALVTGSTGSGKSVTASIIIEEVLDLKIPVLVFDPTTQWTGFVKQLKDKNLLKYYPEFGLKPSDSKSYRGLLYDVETPEIHLDIKKYMNPGEVTVFNLSKLKPGEYDQAVMHIIDSLFQIPWEESSELRMVLVFDECHRLLEKYGGKGGYVALERAAREFRKWGIGLVMVSQVSADFKEAVAGNILTEIQLNTKSIEDIKKIEEKYGKEYSSRITRQSIGVAMVQNPHYNDGKPWFVHFRPTYHNPHKIKDSELKKYVEYSEKIDAFEKQLQSNVIKKSENLLMELKLARDKLKEGHFKMVEIYLSAFTETFKNKK